MILHYFVMANFTINTIFLQEKCDAVQKLQRDGQKLIHAGHFDSATIKYKVNKLDEMFKGFAFQLDLRRRILNQTHGFYRSSQPVCTGNSCFVDFLLRLKYSLSSYPIQSYSCQFNSTKSNDDTICPHPFLTTSCGNDEGIWFYTSHF